MAVIGQASLQECIAAKRLDAEFWGTKYREMETLLWASPDPQLLDQIALRSRKGIFSILAEEYVDDGVPFLRVSNVRDTLLDLNNLAFISPERHAEEPLTNFKKGDLVISKTGTLGAAVIQIAEANISQDLIGIEIADPVAHNPYYIAAFMNSRLGRMQQARWMQGQVQMHLALFDVRRFVIPFPDPDKQLAVELHVTRADRLMRQSEQAYHDAVEALVSAVGWTPPPRTTGWTVAGHEVAEAGRLDAERFHPEYVGLVEHLRASGQARQLRNIVSSPIRKGAPPYYDEAGDVLLINSQNLGQFRVDIEGARRTTGVHWERSSGARLQTNDVLMYATGAYLGRTQRLVTSQRALGGIDVLRIRPGESCDATYLALFLNSPLGLSQTNALKSGSGQAHIYPADLEAVWVWLPGKPEQANLADALARSDELFRESRVALGHAKQEVDSLLRASH